MSESVNPVDSRCFILWDESSCLDLNVATVCLKSLVVSGAFLEGLSQCRCGPVKGQGLWWTLYSAAESEMQRHMIWFI